MVYMYFYSPLKPYALRGDCAFPWLPLRPHHALSNPIVCRQTLAKNTEIATGYTIQLPYDVMIKTLLVQVNMLY